MKRTFFAVIMVALLTLSGRTKTRYRIDIDEIAKDYTEGNENIQYFGHIVTTRLKDFEVSISKCSYTSEEEGNEFGNICISFISYMKNSKDYTEIDRGVSFVYTLDSETLRVSTKYLDGTEYSSKFYEVKTENANYAFGFVDSTFDIKEYNYIEVSIQKLNVVFNEEDPSINFVVFEFPLEEDTTELIDGMDR